MPQRLAGLALVIAIALLAGSMTDWWRPRTPSQIFRDARMALRDGDTEKVQLAIEQIDGVPEYAPHCHFLQACLLMRKGKLEEALDEFRYTSTHPELEVDTLVLGGEAMYKMGLAAEARQAWQRALALNPAKVDAHRWLGALYYDLGAMENALTHLKTASKLAPDDPRPDRLMGLIYKDYERYKEAVDRYKESLRRESDQPDQQQILLELAEAQVRIGDFADAQKTLARCAESPQAMALEAECFIAAGDKQRAARLVRRALASSPEELALVVVLGRILSESGETDDAITLLSEAAAKHPFDYSLHYNLSQAYSRGGNEEKAREVSAIAEDLKQRWEAFSSLHTQAIEQPFNADIRYELGVMAQQLDRADLAEDWFRAALAINPAHVKAKAALDPVP